ncbi:hypothetical protein GCM10022222_28400 [Amycolatopsis ultiminotia]|uniref:HpcH/HpaI aldolase/citrate lyase domain-containing protein n=1 Tax=Amycolatopsis ultiminotia TaxID=543629 RepID=A0ABP6W0W5_9PSEU
MVVVRTRFGRCALGTWVKLAHPDVVDLLALAGGDFVNLDMEHAPIGIADYRGTAERALAIPQTECADGVRNAAAEPGPHSRRTPVRPRRKATRPCPIRT